MKTNNLTILQEAIAQAYVRLGVKSDAYKEAGYSYKNKSDKSIHEAACRVLGNSKVSARVKELQSVVADIAKKEFKITSEEMLRHLDILRRARIDEFVEYYEYDVPVTTTSGTGKNKVVTTIIEKRTELRIKSFDKLSESQKMCIEGIKQTKYGIEIKLHGKEWSIEKINKHIGFYEKDNEQKNPGEVMDPDKREARIAALMAKLNGKV
ncbi:terminase small subunit [Flavobacterium lipolyticum]|uniref:Terminase small subunit n=1 Tax=Flavobacterium lipolyticum TaxID=2893754 RepID=A0ABS8LWH6_9FLAO|nr:terminase small subunit [Flavobacterium sp. F-126]MCC9016935.1 terminase small subunit [Flavobacterium sp. F-126]